MDVFGSNSGVVQPTTQATSMLMSALPEARRSLWAGKALVDY